MDDNVMFDFWLRKIKFTGGVNEETVGQVSELIMRLNQYDELKEKEDLNYKRPPIKMYVDSYGGVIYDGLSLISAMEASETPIDTYCQGKAMSMGFMIFISGRRRYSSKYATFMWHEAGSMAWGKRSDIQDVAEECGRLQTIINKITLGKTKIKQNKLDEVIRERKDWFMNVDEAIKLGVADEII